MTEGRKENRCNDRQTVFGRIHLQTGEYDFSRRVRNDHGRAGTEKQSEMTTDGFPEAAENDSGGFKSQVAGLKKRSVIQQTFQKGEQEGMKRRMKQRLACVLAILLGFTSGLGGVVSA